MFAVTHAITIDAPIERVWPWLAQMGSDRAGWYSWDAIDNGAKDAFVVAVVDAPRDLVLTAPDGRGGAAVSWEHFLESIDGNRTRLIVRGRVTSRSIARAPGRPLVTAAS